MARFRRARFLPGRVMTNAAAPIVSGEPVAVSEGVYVISDNRVPIVPNIGIVVGDSATLVIDTGLGRDNGAYVLEHARRLAGGGQVYVATTHVDPGHGFGMAAFNITARIVFHKTQVEEMHRAVTERVVHIVATREALQCRLLPSARRMIRGGRFAPI